jgi:hypothetical protein
MLEQMPKSIAAIPVSRMLLFFGKTISEALSVGRPPCAVCRTLRREALSSQLISALFGFPHFISSATWLFIQTPLVLSNNATTIPFQLCSGSGVLFITFGCYL